MGKKILAAIIASFIIILTIAILYLALSSPASPSLYVEPLTIQRSIGQAFTVNISVSNVVDLYGWEFKLKWNNTVLQIENVTESAFLKNHGSTFFAPRINSTAGYVLVDCTLEGNISGVSGSGVLATVEFKVKQNGECALDLYDTKLANTMEQYMTHTTRDGQFTT